MARDALDRIDLLLLQLLQADAKISMPKAADLAGLSVASCYKRVQRLRRDGQVAAEVAVVHPRTMGWPLTMTVLVSVESGHSGIIGQIMDRLCALPEVLECLYVTGDYDLVLRVVARSMEDYDAFLHGSIMTVGQIRDVKTLVSLRVAKDRGPIPPAGPPG